MTDALGDIRRCDDCGATYGSMVRECPECGSYNTEYKIEP